MKKLSVLLVFALFSVKIMANEGMWLPQLLATLNEGEMKKMGMKMSAEDIYSVNRGSLKDAIVSFGGFCTGEVISEKGLILTNHHCGFSAISDLSTLENNWLEQGFWSKKMEDELPSKGLTATFIVRIEDVSAAALEGVSEAMDEKTRQSQIDQNLAEIRKHAPKAAWEETMTRAFYDGNQYFLFITETFRDVRLVGAPPSSIGKFGSDTDNWVYPRHTGDFSMFRIYASADNHPADFSAENVPLKPRHSLPISLDGVFEGDFTMIFGFPGRTSEYLPSPAIELQIEKINPTRVGMRDIALGIMDEAMRADAATKLLYAARYATVANGWKKWMGENLGLKQSKAVEKRQLLEADFQKAVDANPAWQREWGAVLSDFRMIYRKIGKYRDAQTRQSELFNNCAVLGLAAGIVNVFNSKDDDQKKVERIKTAVETFFKENRIETDQKIMAALVSYFFKTSPQEFASIEAQQLVLRAGGAEAFAEKMASKSILFQKMKLEKLLAGDAKKAFSKLSKDPLMQFARAVNDKFNASVAPELNESAPILTRLQRRYMAAQMAVFEGKKRFYPDANSTMRVTYGNVAGYAPRDGVEYDSQTYLEGIMEKYKPGDYEFDVPKRLIELFEAKNYGQYAAANGKLPICFIGSNHTTGGNSGSPAIDASGNLIGLNFDRVWEGTMSDLNYDPTICRNIMVDARYILFVVDKFAGAGNLVAEMRLVHPKK